LNRSPGPFLYFLYIGMLFVLMAVGIVLFSWLLLFGALTGLFLYIFMWVRQHFFSVKQPHIPFKSSGRIIEHDDIDRDE